MKSQGPEPRLSAILLADVAGYIIGKFSKSRHITLALGIGGLFTIANISNLVSIPHPVWLAILTTVIFLPCAWLGSRVGMSATAKS